MAVALTSVYNNSYHSPGFDLSVTGLTGYDQLTIERIDNSGEYPVSPVRGADGVTIGGTTFGVTDYEAPVGKSISYQAVATGSVVDDNLFRAVTNGWGTTDTGQAWTLSGGSASDYSVTNVSFARGIHSHTTRGVDRRTQLEVVYANDLDVTFAVNASATPTGANAEAGARTSFNSSSSGNYNEVRVFWTTAGAAQIQVRQVVNGVQSAASSTYTIPGATPATYLNVRYQVSNAVLRAKVWDPGATSEPTSWTVQATGTVVHPPGFLMLRSSLGSASTNTLPWDAYFYDFELAGIGSSPVIREVVSPSTGQTIPHGGPGSAWLKSVGQPALSRRVNVSDWSETSRPGRVLGQYEVLGRRNKVVLRDVLGGREGTITLLSYKDGATWAQDSSPSDVVNLLADGGTLLFQSTGITDTGESDMYFELTDFKRKRVGVVGGDAAYLLEIAFVEVDRPATEQEALSLRTWQDILNQNGTWQDVLDNHTSWLDVLQRSL